MDVVGLGASSVDYVHIVPALPWQGSGDSKVRINSHFAACGGQVANALAGCAALGLTTRFLGPVGSDDNARLVVEALASRGVDVSRVIRREASNQFAVILVQEKTGERIVLWNRDARLLLPPSALDARGFEDARVLHVDDVDQEAAIAAARLATSRGVIVTSDLDRVTERTPELVASVTIPVFAEHVPGALTGEADPERALRKLRHAHAGLLCVTLGTRGAVALDGDRVIHVPAFPVPAVDTTGAGDIFRSGLIYGIVKGWPAERSLRFASAAAAVSCTRLGAMPSVPSLADVEGLLEGCK